MHQVAFRDAEWETRIAELSNDQLLIWEFTCDNFGLNVPFTSHEVATKLRKKCATYTVQQVTDALHFEASTPGPLSELPILQLGAHVFMLPSHSVSVYL